ncbi:hypothetical protein NXV96_22665 [Bacteroides fragilis]|nr:hypothetical protein [Bacteroides fragilis]
MRASPLSAVAISPFLYRSRIPLSCRRGTRLRARVHGVVCVGGAAPPGRSMRVTRPQPSL